MPELPDVEGFRQVAEEATGKRLSHVEVRDASVLRDTTAKTLTRSVVGQRLGRPSRRGKWLIVPADHVSVLIHFGMTGLLDWQPGDPDPHPHDRVIFETEGGRLVYRDQRKLQGLWLARYPDQIESIIGEQGPDALDLSWRAFQAAMAARKGALKAVLMDQAVIAGLGNMLTDEILWRAGIHPSRSWDELEDDERRAVHRATQTVVRSSARQGQIPARRDWLTSQREAPDPVCPRCGSRLCRERKAGRACLWCPTCQPTRSRQAAH